MDLLSFAILSLIVMGFYKLRDFGKWVLRTWHRKKFCDSNRGFCRALVAAGFPDFKEYLHFKEDAPDNELWTSDFYINFFRSELSKQDKEKILNVMEEYCYCTTDYYYDHKVVEGIPICPENYSLISQKVESAKEISRIYLKWKKGRP